ncbi:MAG: ABC transporter ATP-binding protein/permease [Ignavibacteria bacterium]|nr:ABC transporter ATP-binding protein/permease [Ignavibacteria bacterium]
MKEYFRLVGLLKPYRYLLVVSFLLIILYSLSNAVAVYMSIPLLKTLFTEGSSQVDLSPAANFFQDFRNVIDSYIFSAATKQESLFKVCILLITAYLLKNFFIFLQSMLTQYVEKSLITDLRRKLFHKFNSLSLKYFNDRRAGDIVSRFIADVNSVQNTVYVTFTDLIKQPVSIITFLLMAFFINWQLTMIAMITVPVSVMLISYVGKKLKKYGTRVQEKLGEFTSVISENIYGAKIIRAFSMEETENRRFEAKLRDYFRSMMKNAFYINISRPITEIVSVSLGVVIIWYAGNQIFSGSSLKPEEFIGFLIIVFSMMTPVKDLSTVANRIHESYASAMRIFQVLDMETDVPEASDAVEKDSFDDCIEFRNVSFSYTEGRPVLYGLNLKVKKNEKVAIVGLSGAGKSTLIDLLLRFYDVSGGDILIDGINIKKIKLRSLRNLFGMVTQEIILFHDTIRNNIAYGKDADIGEITEAAKNANAHDFIIQTEKGYDTVIGERGLKLSGGQKQRIAIARALLKNAPIMILDEATSSLDTESEQLIQNAIEKLTENRTSIIIAHRLSTVRSADRIIVLHDGKIISEGNHDELMSESNGLYRKLYDMQFGI